MSDGPVALPAGRGALWPGGPRSRSDWLCLGLIGAALLFFAYQGLWDRHAGRLDPITDYVITWSFSEQVARHGEYPGDFTYPLPAVIFKLLFAAPGVEISSIAWMALMLGSMGALLALLTTLVGWRGRERAALPALITFVSMLYFVQWDFKAVNANTVFLALVVGSLTAALRGRAGWAGALLATSMALKLYSVAFLPYLLVMRRDRELLHTLAWIGVLFVLLPALYFGPSAAFALSLEWIARVLGTSSPEYIVELTAYKVSILWVALGLMGGIDAAGQPVPDRMHAIYLGVRALQGAWLLALGAYFILYARGRSAAPEPRIELAHSALLLMAMLFFSPLAEPHHGVLFLLSGFLFAALALEPETGTAWRWTAGLTLALGTLLLKLAPSPLYKGLVINTMLLTHTALLIVLLISNKLAPTPPPQNPPGPSPSISQAR